MTLILRHAALAAFLLLAADPAVAAEKRFGISSFEAIELGADYEVEVTTRAPVSAVAVGSPEALDRVSLETRDGKLVIGERRFAGDDRKEALRGRVTIRVNAAGLRSASLAGAGALRIDRMKGAQVTLGLRGPGQLDVAAVDADRLALTVIGNGTAVLAGSAKKAEMLMSGANVVDASALTVADLTSDSEGAGDHRFRATKTARVTARGIGKTVVLGRPACTVRNAGSGSIECGTAR